MKLIALFLLAWLLAPSAALAETVSAPTINVTSTVEDSFTLAVDLRRDITGFPDIADDTRMAFGSLVPHPAGGGTLIAAEGIAAFITVNTQRAPYTVVSLIESSLLRAGGTETIPDGAFVMNAVYSAADNGGVANEGTANYSGTAIGSHIVYASGGSHRMRTVQAHYTLTDDPSLGATSFVPLDQIEGTYSTGLLISATR